MYCVIFSPPVPGGDDPENPPGWSLDAAAGASSLCQHPRRGNGGRGRHVELTQGHRWRFPKWVCLKMLCTPKPNGFADHYPVFKWLFHWECTLFSDKPKLWGYPVKFIHGWLSLVMFSIERVNLGEVFHFRKTSRWLSRRVVGFSKNGPSFEGSPKSPPPMSKPRRAKCVKVWRRPLWAKCCERHRSSVTGRPVRMEKDSRDSRWQPKVELFVLCAFFILPGMR